MKKIIKKIIYSILSKYITNKGKKGAIYLTFDDGPHPENTLKILETLEKFDVKATFFMTGSEMEKYPEVVKSVVKKGHSIGYHSYSHISYKKLPLAEIRKELSIAQSLAKKANIKINLFRPPYGDLTPVSFFYLMLTGWKTIMWSLDSRDSFDSRDRVLETVDVNKVSEGDILLFHDDYQMTLEILPEVLEKYSANNVSCREL